MGLYSVAKDDLRKNSKKDFEKLTLGIILEKKLS
jgi:hypothetical protein